MNECHAPTASELERNRIAQEDKTGEEAGAAFCKAFAPIALQASANKLVAPHLPKPQTADEIIRGIKIYAGDLPGTETGKDLFNISGSVIGYIKILKRDYPEEADSFAAYLSDALGSSVAQQRYNDAIEGAEADRINDVWEV